MLAPHLSTAPLDAILLFAIEPRTVASLGMTLTLIGLILLVFLDAGSAMVYIVACLVILGFGFALFSSPNTNAIMSSVERRSY